VRSTPAGARVLVDGRPAGRTPAALGDLPLGEHRVRVERDGYVIADRRVVLTAARRSPSITVMLARDRKPVPPPTVTATTLGVDSRPMGASVYVDGRFVGTTPLSLSHLVAGNHTVRLERDGYQHWSSSVHVVAGEKNRVAASLENRD
jgi:hypothetical protein